MDLDFSGILLTVSDVLEHLYCPRFTWFEKYQMLPEFQERRAKVQMGRSLHETRENTNRSYLRKRLNAVDKRIDVSLVSERYCLRGRIDEVLFFEDGTAAPLDYKFARDPGVIYRTTIVSVLETSNYVAGYSGQPYVEKVFFERTSFAYFVVRSGPGSSV